jgi:hypothetical protein
MGTVQQFQKLYWMHMTHLSHLKNIKLELEYFPLVPIDHDNPESIKNIEAWEKLKLWNKPFLTIFGNEDDIMTGAEKTLQKLIPGQKVKIMQS